MLSIDDVINTLNVLQVERETRQEILDRLNKLEKEKKEERENKKVPKAKKEAFIVLKSLKGEISNEDFVASVFMADEGTDPVTILPAIRSATVDFNLQRKRKKAILTFTEVIELLKPKWLKGTSPSLKRITTQWSPIIVLPFEQDENFIKIEKIAD